MKRGNVVQLKEIAEVEFDDIVVTATVTGPNQLRIILLDDSFIDLWFSLKLEDRYSYHWERRAIDGTIHRHDNAPHLRWQKISTFPDHYHAGIEEHVVESYLNSEPAEALHQFLEFARIILQKPTHE